jgi:hypothetical protein
MKTKTSSAVGATALAIALIANQALQAEDYIAAAEAASKITKGPVMATPHGLEDFRCLTYPSAPHSENGPAVPEWIAWNAALTSNPRVREQYPSLTRTADLHNDGESVELKRIRQNEALTDSPRMREEYPELRFDTAPSIGKVGRNYDSVHRWDGATVH